MDLTLVINGHREGHLATHSLKAILAAAEVCRKDGLTVEVIGVLDNPDAETERTFKRFLTVHDKIIYPRVGDLGMARMAAVEIAQGKYIGFCDGDDLWGKDWPRLAFRYAEKQTQECVLHPQWNFIFGAVAKPFIKEHLSTNDPRWDPDEVVQHNSWSALAFGPVALFKRIPYQRVGNGRGYEDWQFNLETLGYGIPHLAVPDTIHWIRLKSPESSLCKTMVATRAVHGPSQFFRVPRRQKYVRRPDKPKSPDFNWLAKELKEAHAIDPRIWHNNGYGIQVYPTATTANAVWKGMTVAPGRHIILMHSLGVGGIEKVARQLASELVSAKEPVTIITLGESSNIAPPAGVEVLDLSPELAKINDGERIFALQKILVQIQPKSIHGFNLPGMLRIVQLNPTILQHSKKYFWTFGEQIEDNGHHWSGAYPNLPDTIQYLDAVFTDSDYWRNKLIDTFGYLPEKIIKVTTAVEKAESTAPTISTDGLKVLWAGRLEHEKGVDFLVQVADKLRNHNVTIDVYGTGSKQESVTKAAKGNKRINYCGSFNSFKQLPINTYRAFMMTSPVEGCPNALLEAMAHGLYPVVPAVGGIAEVVAGLERDPDVFAKALIELSKKVTDPNGNAEVAAIQSKCRADMQERTSMTVLGGQQLTDYLTR